MRQRWIAFLSLFVVIASPAASNADDEHVVSFRSEADSVVVLVNDREIGTYFLSDPNGKIKRPYFAHVRTLEGIQVTRNHPPGPDDRDDHATMHPGIWLAFGDISGVDFWRNRGEVRHVGFERLPTADGTHGRFVQKKQYTDNDGAVICEEEFQLGIHVGADAYLLTFDSTFTSNRPFFFGDQEEMGLGVRVATPITEQSGGLLQDALGRSTAKLIWSQSANWCCYGGAIDGRDVGVAVFCHPDNFRESWFHARDYGLLVANPFGRAAMKKGKPSRVKVSPGESLRLRYGVLVHQGYGNHEVNKSYQDYIAQEHASN